MLAGREREREMQVVEEDKGTGKEREREWKERIDSRVNIQALCDEPHTVAELQLESFIGVKKSAYRNNQINLTLRLN